MSPLGELSHGVLDLLVIGGGVAGCGTALDAASRGLDVGLIEAEDIGSGTSAASSKLIHGGVRYLEQFRFGLVREALRERTLLHQTLAPHLVSGVPFLYPLTRAAWERAYVGAGLALYDLLAGRTGLPRHRHLSRAGTLAAAPALDPEAVTGSVRYHDAQVDDARLTLALALTAERHGARIALRARATSASSDGDTVRVGVLDRETGQLTEVRARRVITAAGPWTGPLYAQLRLPPPAITMSKGVHLVLGPAAIQASCGVITRTPGSVLFLIPWQDHWLVGTTDTPWDGPPERAVATSSDIRYLLGQANRILARPLRSSDIVATYAGVRPLAGPAAGGRTSQASREHAVSEQAPGIFALAGGKLTTYRIMARDAVDTAFRGLGVPASRTGQLPIAGAAGHLDRQRLAQRAAAAVPALPADVIGRLVRRYGTEVPGLLAAVASEPGLGQPVPGAEGHIRAEVVWALRREKAQTIADVLMRRTRIALETPDHGCLAAQEVAVIMSRECGWDQRRAAEELSRYHRELAARETPDGPAADGGGGQLPSAPARARGHG